MTAAEIAADARRHAAELRAQIVALEQERVELLYLAQILENGEKS